MSVQRYRTKPCEIEAIQFTRFNWNEVVEFTDGLAHNLRFEWEDSAFLACLSAEGEWAWVCTINTLEGPMIATEGDYIIRGLRGEFYPCKEDVFKKKYELI